MLDCFFCVSVWTALSAALLISTGRRQFLALRPALSAAAIMIERAAFPATGTVYRFPAPGARLRVDARHAGALRKVPVLRAGS